MKSRRREGLSEAPPPGSGTSFRRRARAVTRAALSLIGSGVPRAIALAAVFISGSMLLTGFLVYTFTERTVSNQLKAQDLVRIADVVASQIDGRIGRAVETAGLLASDDSVANWLQSGETDEIYGSLVKSRLARMKRDFDYEDAYIVSRSTGRIWNEYGAEAGAMVSGDPDADWFFQLLKDGKAYEIVIADRQANNRASVRVNARIGSKDDPLGAAGVQLTLRSFADALQQTAYGNNSHTWLIDSAGNVVLSDTESQSGKNVRAILSPELTGSLLDTFGRTLVKSETDDTGALIDYISDPVQSAGLQLVFGVPRENTVAYLDTIKVGAAAAALIAFASIGFFFVYTSRRLADPYNRAVTRSKLLEERSEEQQEELSRITRQLQDAAAFAKRIQQSVMTADKVLEDAFPEHYILMRPKGAVGGDFYWTKRTEKGVLVALGGCSAHGVPGAMMALLAVSLLNRIAELENRDDPGYMLGSLNRHLRRTLYLAGERPEAGAAENGLDAAVLYIEGEKVVYAGARMPLFIQRRGKVEIVNGSSSGVGYRSTPDDAPFENAALSVEGADTLLLATGGLFDQIGGERSRGLGRRRFVHAVQQAADLPLHAQKDLLIRELERFQGEEEQRDDIAVLAIRPVLAVWAAPKSSKSDQQSESSDRKSSNKESSNMESSNKKSSEKNSNP
ncbi:PP2C family protein-serine/threonine phosphatase [Paenibacillus humicola]|uniref:PP2C family protein-serine/threonine phosphatase n=1 Tax=Paenibacillus humicola TaxID=3110540 RepID=UPI00237C2A74|nr:SpoIIE family protein phosphatase [Paenibacillus humicola]